MSAWSTVAVVGTLSAPVPHAQVGRLVDRELSGPMAVGQHTVDERAPLVGPGSDRFLSWMDLEETGDRVLASAPTDPSLPGVVLSSAEDGDLQGFTWTLDGESALFTTSSFGQGHQLFVVPADGSSPPVRLHPAPGVEPSGTVSNVRLSPDGVRALFEADGIALASVRLDGSEPPVPLSGGLTVEFYLVGATGRAVFLAGDHLYSVPADGSAAPLQLTTAGSPGPVSSFELDSSGTHAVFQRFPHLWSVPVDGATTPVQLSQAFASSGNVRNFEPSPTSDDVVYAADASGNNRDELFVAKVDGSAIPQLLVGVPSGGEVHSGYVFSPDGTRVVCTATTGSPLSNRLLSAAVDGSGVVDLAPSSSFEVTPDSARVVFLRSAPSSTYELASVPLAGGAVQVLSSPIASLSDFSVTPQVVIYEVAVQGVRQLYRIPVAPPGPPPAPVRLNPPLVAGGSVASYDLAPDFTHVVFDADALVDNEQRTFRAELAGEPDPRTFTTPPPTGVLGDVIDLELAGERVVYAADEEQAGVVELFSADAAGVGPRVKLNAAFVPGGDVSHSSSGALMEVTPDGTRVVYFADGQVDGRTEAYVVRVDGSSAAVKLNGELSPGASLGNSQFLVSPDGTRFVYVADELASPGARLRSVPIDGGPSTALAGPSPTPFLPVVTPDSSRVVYVTTQLQSVPIAGGSTADLSGPVASIGAYQVSADSARAVFAARTTAGGPLQLYSTPVGGGTRVLLSPPLVAGGNVTDFATSADGSAVFFLADALVNDQFVLYRVPVDGSAAAAPMHGLVYKALSFRTAGQHVAYVIQRVSGAVLHHLVAADLDGSDAVTLLTDGSISAFEYWVSPDGERVLWLGAFQISAYSVNGGGPVPLFDGGTFAGFVLGGRWILVTNATGQYVVPLAGGFARRLLAPEDGLLFPMLRLVSANHWVWIGQKDERGVFELYGRSFQHVGR